MSKPHTWYDPETDPDDTPLEEIDGAADEGQEASGSIDAESAELVRRLQIERDEALEARKRALADFENFRRRAAEQESRAIDRGMAEICRVLIPVLDQLELALGRDVSKAAPEQVILGIKLVREEMVKALQSKGVRLVHPEVGTAFDPYTQEAMMRRPAPDLEPDAVVEVLQPGYAMGDVVLRAAKVVIAAQPPEPDAG
jgi:molecular chaperone GrpE